jgi:hypothetical protein
MLRSNLTAFLVGVTVASSAGYVKLHRDVKYAGNILTSSIQEWSDEVTQTTKELDSKVFFLEKELNRIRELATVEKDPSSPSSGQSN